MQNIFFISDTHFYHENIVKYRKLNSLEDMHNLIVSNWNNTVSKNDIVYHLGDVMILNNANKEIEDLKLSIVNSLNGKKHLILGNHDTVPKDIYLKYFNRISGCYELSKKYLGLKTILTHIPIHECQLKRYDLNIHGHLHEEKINNSKYLCVSVESINYTPMSLDKVKKSLLLNN